MPFSHGCCINEDKSGLSVGFFFKHLSTKSLMESEKIFLGNFGAGWLTIYSNNSKMAMDFTPGDLGVLGVLGCGEIKLSSKIWGPKFGAQNLGPKMKLLILILENLNCQIRY